MSTHLSTFLVTAGIVTLSATATAAEPHYRCTPPTTALDARVCALARQGPDELRRYVHRTRNMHALRFEDYVDRATLELWEARSKALDPVPEARFASVPPAARK